MPIQKALQKLVDTINSLRIPYMIGGSLASSAHGIFRATNDIDIVAAMSEEHIAPFVADLEGEFYADPETIRAALRQRRPFNVIHLATGFKFDIFIAARNPYLQMQLKRCAVQEIELGAGESIRCSLATAEDIILAKLAWYRAGGEQSERQWNDVRGIRSIQGSRLDKTYLREWARYLKVDDLLERLLSEELA